MRFSKYFIHTLFEVPKEAEIPSHILLLRGSYIHPVAAGIYSLLPLGHRVAEKVKHILRQELNAIGGMEVTMPVLNPAELWKRTKRYFDIGSELFRIKDRKERDFVLAMTHEEVITDIAKQFLTSYRDMPVMLYQIHTKIRDEARPRAGLLRVREFFMNDAYSFHTDFDDLDLYYPKIFNAYLRIFARCGLRAVPIEADSGIMGGTGSHEFMLDSPHGEDRFVVCTRCGYRANTEKAVGLKPALNDLPDSPANMEKVDTPSTKTIAELVEFFGTTEEHFLKTVAYEADGELVLAVVRGDFAISDTKLTNHLKVIHLSMAGEQMLQSKGLYAGYLSPVGLKGMRIIVDASVDERALFVAGANEPNKHFKNVLAGRDFKVKEKVDIAEVREGDQCTLCRQGALEIRRGIELGHTFKLGVKYTAPDAMDVIFLNAQGEQNRVIMGCYGIGVERLMASAVEQWHDDSGIIWPITIAPFQVIVASLGQKPEIIESAEAVYRELSGLCEVLYDDRNESPGVKLKDADLLGIPVRVVISQKLLKNQEIEIKIRQTGEVIICKKSELSSKIREVFDALKPSFEGLPYMVE